MLQVQGTRFLANWRKVDQKEPYPRFSAAYTRFVRGWELFLDFLKSSGLGVPEANQYELTYINHIFEAETPFPAGIEELLPILAVRSAPSTRYLPEPGSVGMRLRYPLPKDKGAYVILIGQEEEALLYSPSVIAIDPKRRIFRISTKPRLLPKRRPFIAPSDLIGTD